MLYKIIDELCDIATTQMDLIRKMSALLIQSDIPDEMMDTVSAKIAEIENSMDASEFHLRRIAEIDRQTGRVEAREEFLATADKIEKTGYGKRGEIP